MYVTMCLHNIPYWLLKFGKDLRPNMHNRLSLIRDGNKTRTHLKSTKPAPFKTQMGGENGF